MSGDRLLEPAQFDVMMMMMVTQKFQLTIDILVYICCMTNHDKLLQLSSQLLTNVVSCLI